VNQLQSTKRLRQLVGGAFTNVVLVLAGPEVMLVLAGPEVVLVLAGPEVVLVLAGPEVVLVLAGLEVEAQKGADVDEGTMRASEHLPLWLVWLPHVPCFRPLPVFTATHIPKASRTNIQASNT